MKVWHSVILLVVIIVLIAFSYDSRRNAFRQADKAIAYQCEKEISPLIGGDDQLFRTALMKCASQAGELKRLYDAGLMPDGNPAR